LLLVLNGSSLSLGNPVNGTRRSLKSGVLYREWSERLAGLESEHLAAELLRAHVGELGVSEGGRGGGFVQIGDLLAGQNEVSESRLSLFGGFVCLVPEGVVFIESDASGQRSTSRSVDFARSKGKGEDEEQYY